MRLKTSELMVRDFTEEDLNSLHELYSDPEVMEYLGGVFEDKQETLDEMRCSCLGDDRIRFAVVESRAGKLVGEVTFILHKESDMNNEVEIGWTIARDRWNKGYATQLTEAMEAQAVKLKATAVFLCCEEEQEIPAHIAEKFGMVYWGNNWGQSIYRKELN